MMRLIKAIFLILVLCGFSSAQDGPVAVKVPFVGQKRWAMVIGAMNYKDMGALRYTVKDAQQFSKALVEAYGFREENVKTLVDSDPKYLAPSSENMRSALSALLGNRDLDRGDLFVFYFSGHGVGTSEGDFLIPTDATAGDLERTGIPIKEVISRIIGAGLKNVLIICDACRAGKENPFGSELQALGKKANIAVLLGCAPGKRSYEYSSLGHGVFTYMLTKAMRNPALRDERSGALWASSIATKVREDVAAYTERDYGNAKQVPATWGDANTTDVMIGAYISKSELTQKSIATLLELGNRMDRAGFVKLLRGWSITYHDFKLLPECIEVLRTIDQLGETTSSDLLLMANSLIDLGRSEEAQRALLRVVTQDPASSAGDYAILQLEVFRTSPAKRRKAARNIFEAHPSWESARTFWEQSVLFDSLPMPEIVTLAAELSAKFMPNSRIGLYFRAYSAYLQSKPEEALELQLQGIKLDGSEPEVNDFLRLLYLITNRFGTRESLAKLIDTGKKDPKYRRFWEEIEFDSQGEKTSGKYISLLKERLRQDLTPYEILQLATRAPVALLSDIQAAAAKHPFSWEAHLARWLSEQAAANWPLPFTLDPNAVKFAPSLLALKMDAFEGMYEMGAGHNSSREEQFLRTYVSELTPHFNEIGSDWGHWNRVKDYMYDLKRHVQFAVIASKYIAPVVAAVEGGIELKETLLQAYINAGWTEEAKKLFEKGGWESVDSTDMPLRYAIHLAVEGKAAEARRVLDANKPVSHKSLNEMRAGLNLLLDAELNQDRARKGLVEFKPLFIIGRQLKILAMVRMIRTDKSVADDLNELLTLFSKTAGLYNPIYIDVYSAVLRRFQQILLILPLEARVIGVEMVPSIAIEWGGNPYFASLHLDTTSKVEDYAGKVRLIGIMYPGGQSEGIDCELVLSVGKDGKITGTGKWATEPIPLSGRVSAAGEVELACSYQSIQYTVRGKLMKRGRAFDSMKLVDATTLIVWTSAEGRMMEFRGRQRS